jgi:hypothetical protein
MDDRIEELSVRITDYLAMGGLFNPELANHLAVRDLLMDLREVLDDRNALLCDCRKHETTPRICG